MLTLQEGHSAPSSEARPASPFQRYQLLRRIARGGMAEVYLAVLRGAAGFERRVALKKILPIYAGMEEFATLFRDEARIWAALNHAGVVQVYDFGKHQGDHWIAMEFVDGPDLEEVLERCRRRGIHPPVDIVIHLGHRVASALEYAHSAADLKGENLGIIHRDISPPNILLSVQGDVKLTDFGVAKAAVRDSATRPGVLRGKYAYMSPEQVQHRPIDHRSDLFGLGILLYETLTGVNPFEGSTDYQTIESVGRGEAEPACSLRPDTPVELERILQGLLQPDPELRYQTGGEVRRDLAALMLGRPDADEPELLVAFIRELFPERTPQTPTSTSHPRARVWEPFAHLLSVDDVPVPERFPEGPGAAVRLEERPPLRDAFWASAAAMGAARSKEESSVPEEVVEPETGTGALRLLPPGPFQRPDSDWSETGRGEWSVEGEDPIDSLEPPRPAASVLVRLSAGCGASMSEDRDRVVEGSSSTELEAVDGSDEIETDPRMPWGDAGSRWKMVEEWTVDEAESHEVDSNPHQLVAAPLHGVDVLPEFNEWELDESAFEDRMDADPRPTASVPVASDSPSSTT